MIAPRPRTTCPSDICSCLWKGRLYRLYTWGVGVLLDVARLFQILIWTGHNRQLLHDGQAAESIVRSRVVQIDYLGRYFVADERE